jgi:3,4-dihydroxy 2-butanone 4-phosphate synthase / GTP cyclohydrolase II
MQEHIPRRNRRKHSVAEPANYSHLIEDLAKSFERVRIATAALRRGAGIADDGSRENEVDFVFHAASASSDLVNFALSQCRGLLCVSISPESADSLGFVTAPQSPGIHAHTGFTISVDARNGIGSGISASDRAQTIRLMGVASTRPQDFVSPGHVFPVRAVPGGLLQRTGHTEAVLEICRMAGLSEAAAMCEILGDDGEALTVQEVVGKQAQNQFAGLAYVSTVDLLWARVFLSSVGNTLETPSLQTNWMDEGEWLTTSAIGSAHLDPFLLPCSVAIRKSCTTAIPATGIRYQILTGTRIVSGGPSLDAAQACVSIFAPHDPESELPASLASFCDLSAKEGIRSAPVATKRIVTYLAAAEHLTEVMLRKDLAPLPLKNVKTSATIPKVTSPAAHATNPTVNASSPQDQASRGGRNFEICMAALENIPSGRDRSFLHAVLRARHGH